MSVFEIAKKRKIEQKEKKIEELTKKMQNLQSILDENQDKIDENEKKKKEYESDSEKSENFQEKINSLSIMLNFFKNLSIIQNITNLLNTKQVFFDMYLSQKNLILIRGSEREEVIDLFVKLKILFIKINDTIRDISAEESINSEINIPNEKYFDIAQSFEKAIRNLIDFLKEFFNEKKTEVDIKKSINRVISEINGISRDSRKIALTEEDKQKMVVNGYILEFWQEAKKMFSYEILEKYITIVNDFTQLINLEDLTNIYGDRLFDIKFLEEETERLEQKKREKEDLEASIRGLEGSIRKSYKDRNSIKQEMGKLSKELEIHIKEKERFEKATTFEELGYKGDKKTTARQKAIKELKIDIKDYIIIPIQPNINKITDVFRKEKQIKVQVGNDTFFTYYVMDEADGRINNVEHLNEDDAALMIPVKYLKEKHVNKSAAGVISLNSEVLNLPGIIVFSPEGRKIDFENYNIIEKEDKSAVKKQISRFLGYNLTDNYVGEVQEHTVFKKYNPQLFIDKEKDSRNDAILECLYENFKKRPVELKKIMIDGKIKINSSDYEDELKKIDKSQKIDVPVILGIYSEINAFLNSEDKMNSCSIDMFYGQLLTEYMKINPKAKADYIEEEYTRVTINGRELSIKPPLPPKKDEVVKRYSRSDEDIAYKIMKLAQIVNRFSKIEDNLSKSSYELKHKLIKIVIDLSKKKERKIIVRRKFDKIKSAWAVYLEIPGYAEIGLHVLDMTNEFKELFLKNTELISLEKYDIKGFSPILSYGVNIELLKELKKLQLVDRVKCCLDMEEDTLVKLITRMGYSKFEYLNFTTEEEKKAYLEKVFSDDNIEKKLKDMQEEER